MDRHGKFCTYCNRKTLHSREGEGSICNTCGTYSSPSQEEIAARSHRRVSSDAIETITHAQRIRETLDRESSEKAFLGKIATGILLICIFLTAVIVFSIAWILLR